MSLSPPRASAALVALALLAPTSSPRAQEPAPAPAPSAFEVAAPPPPTAQAPTKLLEVTVGFVHFDYEEREGGVFLDGEKGFVPGVGVALQLDGLQYFGRFTGRVSVGSVDYDGHVQTSDPLSEFNGLDAKTTTRTRFLQGEALLGVFFDPGHRFAALAAVGRRQWVRSIQPTTVTAPSGNTSAIGGLDETYAWWELQAGLRATLLRTSSAEVLLDARLVRTASPTMSLDLSSLGASGTMSFSLGARTGYRVAAGGRVELTPTMLLTVGGSLEWYAFDRSAVNAYGFYEPSSTTRNVGVDVGLAFRL